MADIDATIPIAGAAAEWSTVERARLLIRACEEFQLENSLHVQSLTIFGRQLLSLDASELLELETRYYTILGILREQKQTRDVH